MNTEKSKLKRQPLLFLSKHRNLIALAFFVLVAGIALRHVVVGGGPSGHPDLCAYCPMGAVASLYVYLVHGQFLHRIHPTSFVVLGAVFLVTFLSRRAFCGWICPFGTLQEWLGRLGKKVFRRRIEPPAWLDRNLRHLKYVVLLLVVGGAWYFGTLVFRKYDPYLAFFDFGESLSTTWPGYVILGGVLVGALAVERFWCRYACPLGALLGLFSRVGIMKITHQEETCTSCKAGIYRCPVGINPTLESDRASAECIQCMECVAVCPIHNAAHVEAFGKRLRPGLVGVSIVGAFLLVIGAAQYLGAWQTVHGGRGRMGRSADNIGSEAVTGSMTLDHVREVYQMEESELRQRLGIDEAVPMDTPIRDLKETEPTNTPSAGDIQTILDNDPSRGGRQTSADADLIRGWMTLEHIRNMYGMSEPEFRRLVGLPTSVAIDTPLRELEMLGDETLPTTADIRRIFSNYAPAAAASSNNGRNRATAPSRNWGSSQPARGGGRGSSGGGMGGGGRGQSATGALQAIRGSTTLQEALAYRGKTLEQFKADWHLSFVDPQTNLGTLARTVGIPMWDLRAYFER